MNGLFTLFACSLTKSVWRVPPKLTPFYYFSVRCILNRYTLFVFFLLSIGLFLRMVFLLLLLEGSLDRLRMVVLSG